MQTVYHYLNNQPTGNFFFNDTATTETDYADSGKTITAYTRAQGGNPMQTSVHMYQNSLTYADTETQYDSLGRPARVKVANAPGGHSWYQVENRINQTTLKTLPSNGYK
jgi:S-formylglutathione hydrolase FrmB